VKRRGVWRTADGGLVAALQPALELRDSRWVGWDGGAAGVPPVLPGLETRLIPVHLRRNEVEAYYHGFANRTLWPLFHSLPDRAVLERRWWRQYVHVNELFAEKGLAAAPEDGVLWVHDYQLALVPRFLRRLGAGRRIGFFLHIPFPSPELYARLPWRSQLLEGMLGGDVTAFQTQEARDNFQRCCLKLIDGVSVDGPLLHLPDGRGVTTAVHGASVDVAALRARATSPSVERILFRVRRQFRGRRLLVGVDRLDYTKGIVERLRSLEILLEQRPDLRGHLALAQIAVPSRDDIREYRDLRSQVEELVGRINGRFTSPGADVPVHYLYRGVSPDRLLAYYRAADVCLVTPLRDGMNLVAKEFVVCQAAGDGSGVLVLSEFAGAAEELPEALPCNPFDVEGLTGTIALALELEPDDRRGRIQAMSERIASRDVCWWLTGELRALERQTLSG
jgi:trehalose 6-phosphate synthase